MDTPRDGTGAPDAMTLTIETQTDETSVRLDLRGELDLAGRPALLEAVASLPLEGQAVEHDLSRLAFMDSTGCRALLEVGGTARERGAESYVVVAATTGTVVRLLELTGLSVAIPIRWTEAT